MQLSNIDWPSWLSLFDKGMVQIFITVVLTLVIDLVVKRIIKMLARRFKQTKNPWDDAVIKALKKPVSLLIWVIGLTIAGYIIQQETQQSFSSAATTLRNLGVVFVVFWFLYRLAENIEGNVIQKHAADDRLYDKTTAVALGRLVRLALVITGGLVVLQTIDISISGVLAFGGLGGIAIGFAAQGLLSNFFGALMVYWDRPFNVGDWIRSPDRKIEGTVEDIGWRLTRIRTLDQVPLYIPNSIFTSIVVENPSRMNNRRIYETIGIRYADLSKMTIIVDEIKIMLKAHTEIDLNRTLLVGFNAFSSSSVDFMVYAFTKTTNWVQFQEIKQDVLLKIAGIVEAHDAQMAFPTTTLDLPPEMLNRE
jgi:MscS family membrane protein